MNILVFGSEGTIGKRLCDELEVIGHVVFRSDLQHCGKENYVRCDIGEYRQCMQVFDRLQKIDIVYLLAAEFGRLNGEEYFEQVWKTNVIGTRNILEIQKKHGFKLIFFSSSEIYGDLPTSALSEEVSLLIPLRQRNDYAISKWVNEQQIMNFEERYRSPITRIRLFNAYGPGEEYTRYRSVVCLFCYRMLTGQPITVYKNYHRVFMYIDDLIPTLCRVVTNGESGEVYNIGGKEYCSVEHLVEVIKRSLTDEEVKKLDISYLDEDRHNVTNKRPNIEKASCVLGHSPNVTLEQGIPKTIEWMRDFYGL